jgi:hypothetical protein
MGKMIEVKIIGFMGLLELFGFIEFVGLVVRRNGTFPHQS